MEIFHGTSDGIPSIEIENPGSILILLKDCRVPFGPIWSDFEFLSMQKQQEKRLTSIERIEPQLHTLQVLVEVPAKG